MADDFPEMFRVRQRLDATPPVDVAASEVEGFSPIRGQLMPGMRVGVCGGSRGISNLAEAVVAVEEDEAMAAEAQEALAHRNL